MLPGNYKVSDCVVDGEQPRCKPCPERTFMPDCDNGKRCEFCKHDCPDNRHIIVQNCTTTNYLEFQCKMGFYWRPYQHDPQHGECMGHKKCKAGEGLVAKGTPFEDTVCERCIEGSTFSNSISSNGCQACTDCNASYILLKCTVTKDTMCDCKEDTPPDIKGISKDGGDTSSRVVVAIVVSLVIVLVVIIVAIICFKRRGRNGDHNGGSNTNQYTIDIENGHVNLPKISSSYSSTQQNGHHTAHGNRQKDRRKSKCPSSNNKLGKDSIKPNSHEERVHETSNGAELRQNTKDYQGNVEISSERTLGNDRIAKRTGPNEIERIKERLDVKSEFVLKQNSDVQDDEEDLKKMNIEGGSKETIPSVVNGISTRSENDTKTDTGFSMDAGYASPRMVQRVSSSIDNNSKSNTATNKGDIVGETGCSHSIEMKTLMHPDGTNEPKFDNGVQRPHFKDSFDKFWDELFTFLICRLQWVKFKEFYRKLCYDTIGLTMPTVESSIDHACQDNKKVKERMYQLLREWRQIKNPGYSADDILVALKKCKENRTMEEVSNFVKKSKCSVQNTGNSDVSSDFAQNIGEAHPHGELSTSANISGNTQRYSQQENNLKMMKLKEVRL